MSALIKNMSAIRQAIEDVLPIKANFQEISFSAAPQYDPTAGNNTRVIFAGGGVTHRQFGDFVLGRNSRLIGAHRKAGGHGVAYEGEIVAWISDDDGDTVSAEFTIAPSVVGRDQRDVAMGVTHTGRIVIVWTDTDSVNTSTGNTYFKRVYSDENGAPGSWSEPLTFRTVPYGYARTYGTVKKLPADSAGNARMAVPAYYRVNNDPDYRIGMFYSDDNAETFVEGAEVFTFDNGVSPYAYTETDHVWLNAKHAIAIARGDVAQGMAIFKTTDGGATPWVEVGAVGGTVGEDAVAPAVNMIHIDGEPYVFVSYCDRGANVTKVRWAKFSDAVTSATAFTGNVRTTSAADMINASGYQKWAVYPNGQVLMVEFKEYTTPGDPGSDVRMVRLAPRRWVVPEVAPYKTFTPIVQGGTTAGAPTYTTQAGYYIRIGQLVFCTFDVQISAKGGLAGTVRIEGFPHRVKNAQGMRSGVALGFVDDYSLAAGYESIKGRARINGFGIELMKEGQAASTTLADTDISDTFSVQGSVWYVTDDL